MTIPRKNTQKRPQGRSATVNIIIIIINSSVQFSSASWLIGGQVELFSRETLPAFSAGGHWEQFWQGQGCPFFDVVHPAFPLPTTASPTLQGALKNGFREVVLACDMPEPFNFPSLDSRQKRFLWTHKDVDLAPHLVVGLVLQGDAWKFPHTLSLQKPWSFV